MFASDSRFGWFDGWLVAHPNDIAKPCGRLQLLIFVSEMLKIREMLGKTERFGIKGKEWQWDLITIEEKALRLEKFSLKVSRHFYVGFRIRWKCSKSLILKLCNMFHNIPRLFRWTAREIDSNILPKVATMERARSLFLASRLFIDIAL